MLYLVAAAAAAFDLACAGTIEIESLAGKRSEPYAYDYRIDLDTKKWCDSGCGVIRDIAEVQPGFLVLSPPKNIDTPTRREFYEGRIDRTTGRQSILSTSGRRAEILIMKWEGRCERRPFSGFPQPQTKF